MEEEENDTDFGFGDEFIDTSRQDQVGNEALDDFGSGFSKLAPEGDGFGGFSGDEDFEQFAPGAGPSPPLVANRAGEGGRRPNSNGEHPRVLVPNGSPVPLVKFKRATSNGLDRPKNAPVVKAPHLAERMGSFGKKTPPAKVSKGSSTPTISAPLRTAPAGLAKSIAINLNKNITKACQPFTCGYDMTTNQQLDATGLCLRRIFLNCMMVAPGSFTVAIRTQPNGKGECLAKESGISATATFNQTVIDFSSQPFLTMGRIYYYHLKLECGAFKFQGAPVATKVGMHKYDAYRRKEKVWQTTMTSFVTKPIFRKAMPKLGDKCGYLLLVSKAKGGRTKEKKRASLRRGKPQPGLRKFVVIENGCIKCFADIDGMIEFSIPMSEIEYIESNARGGAESVDFSVITRSTEYQFTATSGPECAKWLKILGTLNQTTARVFGDSRATGMMF